MFCVALFDVAFSSGEPIQPELLWGVRLSPVQLIVGIVPALF